MRLAAGLALALASTFALNWGWLAQHGAAHALPRLSIRRPVRSLRTLFGHQEWLLGFGAGLGGWALYVTALVLAPISVVQAASAGGIGLLALLARRRGEAISGTHWLAVAAATAGLALLGVSLAGGTAGGREASLAGVATWLSASALVAAAVGAAGARVAAGAGLGLAAGTLYAAGDVATKAATFGGRWLVLVPAILLAHGLAFAALQAGFQRGRSLVTVGTSTLATNALPIVGGVALFHERLPGGAWGGTRAVAFTLVVASAALLARPRSG